MSPATGKPPSPLVPGRECGDCTECCINLRIHTATLKKPANIPCLHLADGGGCDIYDARPSTCRSFHCGWRMLGGLADAWRPDRSRIMIRVEEDGLVLDGMGSVRPVLASPVLKFISTCIRNGVTVYLGMPGRPGRRAAKLLLNELLAPAVDARAMGALVRELVRAIDHGAASVPPADAVHPVRFRRTDRGKP